jgi:hypothetical protein
MKAPGAAWQPCVGDRVHVKGHYFSGVVQAIEHRGRRWYFILNVGPLSITDSTVAFRLRTTVGPIRSAHTLDELEPYP